MPNTLPINLQDLLRQRTVEGERIEYKAGWNPDPILRSVCAFANFENLGGGYIVIGQDCDARGQPIFPPVGLSDNHLDKIQQELRACCNLNQPPYFPILSIQRIEERNLLLLWAPGVEHHHADQGLDVEAVPGAPEDLAKMVEAERVPQFSQRSDVAIIAGRFERDRRAGRRFR